MQKKIIDVLHDPVVKKMTQLFLVILLLFITISVWKWHSLPPQIPLFYSLPRGGEQLVTPFLFMLLPALSLLFFILNFSLAVYIFERKKLAGTLLVIMGTVFALLLFITYLKIIFLVA